jgi:hypothetical protein
MKLARYALVVIGVIALAGCAGGGAEQLASSRTVALEGTDPTVLQAPADGQVSVYDLSIDNLIYSGTIRKGQELVFDPVARTVTVNGLLANSKPLFGGDSLKITFDANK